MSYTIAAIPTVYRGRQYRSRLEARWAAFFDLLGWQHEYEPFDLGSWSPDFLLGGRVLVEVKPLTAFDSDVAAKMSGAVERMGDQDDATLLLLAAAPWRRGAVTMLGWRGHWEGTRREDGAGFDWGWAWHPAAVAWLRDPDAPRLLPDLISFAHANLDGTLQYCAHLTDLDADSESIAPYADHALGLWAQATNAVQWKPPA